MDGAITAASAAVASRVAAHVVAALASAASTCRNSCSDLMHTEILQLQIMDGPDAGPKSLSSREMAAEEILDHWRFYQPPPSSRHHQQL
mmetsp:Transcript_55391/g.110080  ORF Transcript_55391/g.110080 Transcript_55391/m.110080 type:complete len:89 (+) Transcript_55391:159-425(+)